MLKHGHQAFLFNNSAKYRAGGHFRWKSELSLTDQHIAIDNKGSRFKALFQDVFADYQNPPLTGDVTVANKAWRIWTSTPFDWWQCQLNVTVWCVTAGCGVSFEDHLQANDLLLVSLYLFHVYYTTRRLLEEMHITFPGDKSHSWYQNDYDARAYKRLCCEFGVLPETDCRSWIMDVKALDHGAHT